MRSLIVGYGSIGKKHSKTLSNLGSEVAIVSSQDNIPYLAYKEIIKAIKSFNPNYVIICNPTDKHMLAILDLIKASFTGTVLIEKPLFNEMLEMPKNNFDNIFVAYNLRFHPALLKLKEILKVEKTLSANIYVGQYLPDWRPTQDYRKTYSAKKNKGGGVLRDLSHELDYTSWIFGDWKSLTSLGGKVSKLEIDSEDIYSILMETEHSPSLSIQMSYLDRIKQRKIIVNTDSHCIEVDLIQNYIKVDGDLQTYEIDSNYTYSDMHLSVISKKYTNLCTLDEGLKIMKLIKYIEKSNNLTWEYNE
jgi:predicted dehydrogenase